MALVQRYINLDSTAGGTGLTNATSGTDRAYASTVEWEAAEQTDLVTAGDYHVVDVTSPSGLAETDAIDINGWTTAWPNNYVHYRVTDNHGGSWNTSTHRVERDAATYPSHPFSVTIDASIVENLQTTTTGTPTYTTRLLGYYADTSVHHRTIGCIVKGWGIGTGVTQYGISNDLVSVLAGNLDYSHEYINNIVYDVGTHGILMSMYTTAGTPTGYYAVYNNTVYGCGDTNIRNSFNGGGIPARMYNNVSQAAGVSDFYDAHSSSVAGTNLSSDATAPGTGSVTNVTLSFADLANRDLHLASTDTQAIDAGTDLSGDTYYAFNTDIDGDTRPQGTAWDIGADEYVSSGGASVSPGAGFMAVVGLAASIVAQITNSVLPTPGAETVAGSSPAVSITASSRPGVGILYQAGEAPSVVLERNTEPSVGVSGSTGELPTVTLEYTISPVDGFTALTGETPLVVSEFDVAATDGQVAQIGLSPTVTTGVGTAPEIGSQSVTGEVQSVGIELIAAPGAGSVYQGGVLQAAFVINVANPLVADAVQSSPQPAVEIHQDAFVPAADVSQSGETPVVDVFRDVRPGAGSAQIAGERATIALRAEVFPSAGTVETVSVIPVVYGKALEINLGGCTVAGLPPALNTRVWPIDPPATDGWDKEGSASGGWTPDSQPTTNWS